MFHKLTPIPGPGAYFLKQGAAVGGKVKGCCSRQYYVVLISQYDKDYKAMPVLWRTVDFYVMLSRAFASVLLMTSYK